MTRSYTFYAMRIRDEDIVRDVLAALKERVRAIVLFGSQARDAAFADSDIDIAVFMEPGSEITRDLYRLLGGGVLDRPELSIVAIGTESLRPSGFLLELAGAYRVLWEREPGWAKHTLASLQDDALAAGARRWTTSSGDAYWVGI